MDTVEIKSLSRTLSSQRPEDPDKNKPYYNPWTLYPGANQSIGARGYRLGAMDDRFLVSSHGRSDEIFLKNVSQGDNGYVSLKNGQVVLGPRDHFWQTDGFYLADETNDHMLTMDIAKERVSITARFWQDQNLADYQDTNLLFMPVPTKKDAAALKLATPFFEATQLPLVMLESIGPRTRGRREVFKIVNNATAHKDGTVTITARSGTQADREFRLKVNGEAYETVNMLDETYRYIRLRPLRWFSHWPMELEEALYPENTDPSTVAQGLSYSIHSQHGDKDKFPEIVENDGDMKGWERYVVYADPRPKNKIVFHAFFNGPYGYRARYFMAPELGKQYEREVLNAIFHRPEFKSATGAHAKAFQSHTAKIWTNTHREPTDIVVLNGIWEQPYILKVNGYTEDVLGQSSLRFAPVMQIIKPPGKQGKGSIYKGIRVDSGTGFEIKSAWRKDGKLMIDNNKALRGLEISTIGFV